jgi:16S rRNA processing protein RimM
VDKSSDWIVVGRFGRAHGVKGNIVVHSFTDPHDNIKQYASWFAFIDRQWRPIKPTRIDIKTKHIIAQVEGYETLDQVVALTNVDIAVERSQLAALPDNEYYWHELVGMQVINLNGDNFGEVSALLPTGSNDVLVVQGDKRHLIPYLLGESVLKIDREQRLMTVDWDINF